GGSDRLNDRRRSPPPCYSRSPPPRYAQSRSNSLSMSSKTRQTCERGALFSNIRRKPESKLALAGLGGESDRLRRSKYSTISRGFKAINVGSSRSEERWDVIGWSGKVRIGIRDVDFDWMRLDGGDLAWWWSLLPLVILGSPEVAMVPRCSEFECREKDEEDEGVWPEIRWQRYGLGGGGELRWGFGGGDKMVVVVLNLILEESLNEFVLVNLCKYYAGGLSCRFSDSYRLLLTCMLVLGSLLYCFMAIVRFHFPFAGLSGCHDSGGNGLTKTFLITHLRDRHCNGLFVVVVVIVTFSDVAMVPRCSEFECREKDKEDERYGFGDGGELRWRFGGGGELRWGLRDGGVVVEKRWGLSFGVIAGYSSSAVFWVWHHSRVHLSRLCFLDLSVWFSSSCSPNSRVLSRCCGFCISQQGVYRVGSQTVTVGVMTVERAEVTLKRMRIWLCGVCFKTHTLRTKCRHGTDFVPPSDIGDGVVRFVLCDLTKPLVPSCSQLDNVDGLLHEQHDGFTLSLLDSLFSKGLRTVKSIPPKCRLGFSRVLKRAINKVIWKPDDISCWVSLLVVPLCLLKTFCLRSNLDCKPANKRQRQEESITNAIHSWGVPGGSMQLVRETLAKSSSPMVDVDEGDLGLSERNLNQCKRKICDDHYTATVRVFSSSGVAPYNDATLQELKSKHPFKSAPSLPDMPFNNHHLIASQDVVLDRIKSFPRGTSCGRDGLCAQHLMEYLSGAVVAISDELISSITHVVNLFLEWMSHDAWRLVSKGEAILNAINRLVEDRRDDVGLSMLLVDFQNAFNLVDRNVMLEEVRLRCPAISRWVEFCYSALPDCTTENTPYGKVIELITEDGPRCGLHLNVDKTEIFWTKKDPRSRVEGVFPPNISRPLHGVKLLGGAVSVDFGFSSELAIKRMSKTIELMDAAANINEPQCELLLIRACTCISKLYFAMRTCPPRVFVSAQCSFDMALRSALECIVTASGSGFDDWQWIHATLPFAFGGIGVYSAGDVLNYAFLASRLQSAALQTKILRHVGIVASGSTFDDALCVFNTSMEIDFLSNLSEIAAPKLMKKMTDIYFTRVTKDAESTFSLSPRQMALWKSQIEDHTSDWLRVVLISGLGKAMNGKTYRCVMCYRLGVPLFSISKPCSTCSKVFTGDMYGDHVVSCVGIIGIKHRHNAVRDTLVDICFRSGVSAGKEVDIGLGGGCDKALRPADMLLYSWDGGLDVCVDLTGSSPLTQTGMAVFVPHQAVIDDAQRKRGKYMAKCAAIGYGFIPFSFSSLGELEADAVTLLKRIQKFSMTQDIEARAAIHIFNRISFALAKEVRAQIVSQLPFNLL
nr:hypothetical protein [Tanacetum cinerariifolium]